MKKNIFRSLCFFLTLLLFLSIIHNIFSFKSRDGIYNMKKFYEQDENSIDLLIIGSSHTTVDIDSAMLWNKYGIASYTLWGSGQPIWNSYFYLVEALKTQKPKLIILEGYTLTTDYQYGESDSIIKNTYGLKWSANKIEALRASVPETEYINYLIELGQYHNRYVELDKNDFGMEKVFPYIDEYKGTEMSFALDTTNVQPDIAAYSQDLNTYMTEKNEYYYRSFIELAQENNIPILIAISPYPLSANEYSIFCQAEKIAREYNVEFINGNNIYEEIGIDFQTDFADGDHLNYVGCLKWTEYLAKEVEKYSLPNHKNDEKYNSWEINARYINRFIYNHEFQLIGTPVEYINAMSSNMEDYTIVLSLDGTYKNENIDLSPILSAQFNIPKAYWDLEVNGAWIISAGEIIWNSDSDNCFYHLDLGNNDLSLEKNEKTKSTQILFNNIDLKKVQNGINILIYDNFTHSLVEAVGFDAKGNYNCIK